MIERDDGDAVVEVEAGGDDVLRRADRDASLAGGRRSRHR